MADTQFKYPEAPPENKIIDGESNSAAVSSNEVKPSKEKVSTVVGVPLSNQKMFLNNLHKKYNRFDGCNGSDGEPVHFFNVEDIEDTHGFDGDALPDVVSLDSR